MLRIQGMHVGMEQNPAHGMHTGSAGLGMSDSLLCYAALHRSNVTLSAARGHDWSALIAVCKPQPVAARSLALQSCECHLTFSTAQARKFIGPGSLAPDCGHIGG